MSLLHDSVYIIVSLFAIALVSIVAIMAYSTFNTAIQASDVNTIGKTATSDFNTSFPRGLDWIVMLLLVGLPLVSFGLAFFNNISPVFFWMSLGVIYLVVLVGYGFSDGWAAFISDGAVLAQAIRMPMTNYVMSNFWQYSIFVFLVTAIGTYVKLRANTYSSFGGVY